MVQLTDEETALEEAALEEALLLMLVGEQALLESKYIGARKPQHDTRGRQFLLSTARGFAAPQQRKDATTVARRMLNRLKDDVAKSMVSTIYAFKAGRISRTKMSKELKARLKRAYFEAYAFGIKTSGHSLALRITAVWSPSIDVRGIPLSGNDKKWILSAYNHEAQFLNGFIADISMGQGRMPYDRRARMYADALENVYNAGRMQSSPKMLIDWVPAGHAGRPDAKVCASCLALRAGSPYTSDSLPTMPRSGLTLCFVHPRTPVLTANGWKPIDAVVTGDSVLTHKKRFRQVVSIVKQPYCGLSYRIAFRSGGRVFSVRVTADHKFLCADGWVGVSSLGVGDKVKATGLACGCCDSVIDLVDGRRIANETCSASCDSRFHEKYVKAHEAVRGLARTGQCSLQRWHRSMTGKSEDERWGVEVARRVRSVRAENRLGKTYEDIFGDKASAVRAAVGAATRERISRGVNPLSAQWDRLRGRTYEEVYGKRRAAVIRSKLSMFWRSDAGRAIRVENMRRLSEVMRSDRVMTAPEAAVDSLLSGLGVEYEYQWPYNVQGVIGIADFYIPVHRVVIEVDGDYWHNFPDGLDIDRVRTEALRSAGYTVVRLWENVVKDNIQAVDDGLRAVLSNHLGRYLHYDVVVDSVETSSWGSYAYCINVDEDASFVARGGIISHNCLTNCRCRIRFREAKNREELEAVRRKGYSRDYMVRRLRAIKGG